VHISTHLIIGSHNIDKTGTAAEAVWLLSQLKAFLHPSAVASSLQHTALTGTLHADDEVYPTEVNGHVGERSKIAYNKVLHFTRRFVYVLGCWPAANLRGGLRPEIWENLFRKSEKIVIA
jgi:hypothetical protein